MFTHIGYTDILMCQSDPEFIQPCKNISDGHVTSREVRRGVISSEVFLPAYVAFDARNEGPYAGREGDRGIGYITRARTWVHVITLYFDNYVLVGYTKLVVGYWLPYCTRSYWKEKTF